MRFFAGSDDGDGNAANCTTPATGADTCPTLRDAIALAAQGVSAHDDSAP